MTISVIVLILINLALWLIFLIKFKDLFNTDKIIEKTRSQLDLLVKDINNNAETNINIIEDRIRKLKFISKEADSKIIQLESKLNLLDKKIIESNKKSSKTESPSYSKNSNSKNSKFDNAYSVTKQGEKFTSKQNTLFDSLIDTNVQINVDSSGDSYAKIPVVEPKGFEFEVISDQQNQHIEETNENEEVDLKNQIVRLYNQGKTLEEIALALQVSPVEVQFVLDFIN